MFNNNKIKKTLKASNGITLIALVVTIIVLLILAGISIQMLTGDNGILTRAGEAKEKTNIEQLREQIQLEVLGSFEKNGDLVATKIKDNIENHITGAIVDGTDFDLDVTVDGYIFSIDSSGNVAYNGKDTPAEPVTNPHSNEDWIMAWVCKNGEWESTPITSSNESDLDGADIVAKLYEVKTNGVANKITPKSFLWQEETISFKEGTEYDMVIEGSGEMPALMTTEGNDITGAFGWQAPSAMYLMKYLMTHTMPDDPDDNVFTPYITDVIVCEGITKIGDYAFGGGTGLKKFKIASTVKEVGINSFMMCNGLEEITIPSTVKTVNLGAFQDCKFLKKVSVKKGVEKLEGVTFCNCTSLKSVSIPSSVTTIKKSTFWDCRSLTSVSIPNSVTTIGDNAFGSCTSLTSVSIPNSVTTIGDNAFGSCTSLTSISIPSSVTTIKKSTFWHCRSLTSVSIPNSVTTIGNSAFESCTSLTSVSIPNSVTSIGDGAFFACMSLAKVKILSGNLESLSWSSFRGVKDNIKFYVLNNDTKQKLINDGEIPESKIEIVTESEMNRI